MEVPRHDVIHVRDTNRYQGVVLRDARVLQLLHDYDPRHHVCGSILTPALNLSVVVCMYYDGGFSAGLNILYLNYN